MARFRRTLSIAILREHRHAAVRRLAGMPNVIGTMLGVRIRGGEILRERVLSVLVSKKLAEPDLKPHARLPRALRVRGLTVPIDVLAIGRMVPQAAFPTDRALTASDSIEVGTITAFARSDFELFGVTCAHAIQGADGNPFTQSPVAVWSPALERYVQVGVSASALAGGGAGVPGAFGYSDAALFTLGNPELRARTGRGQVLAFAPAFPSQRLVGVATTGVKSGTVIGLDQDLGGELADVVIRVDAPGTFRGDSGMLWCDSSGRAIAIHARGQIMGPGTGSPLTTAMSAARAAEGLGVQFIRG